MVATGCSLPWRPAVGGLLVQISDGNAQVYLNDTHVGADEVDKSDLKPGTYSLRLEPTTPGKQVFTTTIKINPGTSTSVLWSYASSDPLGTGDILELAQHSSKDNSELSVVAVPEGAVVSINDVTQGLAPVIVENPPTGNASLALRAVAHEEKTISINIPVGYRMTVTTRLARDVASLNASPAASLVAPAIEPTPTPASSPAPGIRSIPSPPPILASPTPATAASASANIIQGRSGLVAPYITVKPTGTGWLRVRDQAGSSGQELAKIAEGGQFPYKSSQNGWYEIEYSLGKTGWVSGQYVDLVR